jgi:hypothetical protein
MRDVIPPWAETMARCHPALARDDGEMSSRQGIKKAECEIACYSCIDEGYFYLDFNQFSLKIKK